MAILNNFFYCSILICGTYAAPSFLLKRATCNLKSIASSVARDSASLVQALVLARQTSRDGGRNESFASFESGDVHALRISRADRSLGSWRTSVSLPASTSDRVRKSREFLPLLAFGLLRRLWFTNLFHRRSHSGRRALVLIHRAAQ